MKSLYRLLKYWLPPFLWMVCIFVLSSRQHFTITKTYFLDFLIFKFLHMVEYALLYILIFRAFYLGRNKKKLLESSLLYSFIFSVLYALSDEFHQTLVPTREGRLRDVLIDTSGIFLVFIFLKYYSKKNKLLKLLDI